MNLAVLFSGGKDSTYAIFQAKKMGHDVKCLVTIITMSAESHLLHYPNINATKIQASAMKIPQIFLESKSDDTQNEIELIKQGLFQAKKDYLIEGIVHGGIISEFQKNKFEKIANDLGLKVISPLGKRIKKCI